MELRRAEEALAQREQQAATGRIGVPQDIRAKVIALANRLRSSALRHFVPMVVLATIEGLSLPLHL